MRDGNQTEVCGRTRKGFNGLHALVSERLGEDLKHGALFVFSNRRHTRIKIICWDGTGIWVLAGGREPFAPLLFESVLGASNVGSMVVFISLEFIYAKLVAF